MKNSNHNNLNSSVRFLTIALSILIAALAVVYEYTDKTVNFANEELVSESEFDVSYTVSSLARVSTSKVVKFQRTVVINIIDGIFSINAVNIIHFFTPLFIKTYVPRINSFFLKSDILKNAP